MKTKNETSQINANTLKFLESLSTDRLNRLLLSQRYMADVIKYAQHSNLLTEKICGMLDGDYARLSPEERARYGELRSQALSNLRSSRDNSNLMQFQRPLKTITEKPVVQLAAATEEAEETERGEPVRFGVFSVADSLFEVAEEPDEGTVLLYGPVPPNATHILFGSESFALVRAEAEGPVMIEDIGLIETERFLQMYRAEPKQCAIRFFER